MSPNPSINLWGTLDLLVLRAIDVHGPIHGLGVVDVIERCSGGSIEVEDGALYRCLHRLERRELLSAEWRMSEKNRRAKFYALTPSGRKLYITHSGANDKVTIYQRSHGQPVPAYVGEVTVGDNPFGLAYVP